MFFRIILFDYSPPRNISKMRLSLIKPGNSSKILSSHEKPLSELGKEQALKIFRVFLCLFFRLFSLDYSPPPNKKEQALKIFRVIPCVFLRLISLDNTLPPKTTVLKSHEKLVSELAKEQALKVFIVIPCVFFLIRFV